ncbi:MAG: hypothetical protein R3E01_33870 [Pirellulaceae bacterium]|nr:hypothetical protein [Planctomycetales bacterium]
MTGSARVTSIDAIRQFRQDLVRYEESTRKIVDTLLHELRRAIDWVESDRTTYWPAQVRGAERAVVAARNALERCRLVAQGSQRQTCLVEQKEVERAVRRQRLSEQKVKDVSRWRYQINRHGEEFQGKLSQLTHYLDNDVQKAIAALDRIVAALERYAEHHSSGREVSGGGERGGRNET